MTSLTPPNGPQLVDGDPDWTLVGRYFRGECAVEEAEAIERWEAASRANASVLAFMRTVWAEAEIDWPAIDEGEAWKAMRAKMDMVARPLVVRPLRVLPREPERPRRVWLRRALLAGAAAVVVATVAPFAWNVVIPSAPQPPREYVTAPGERGQAMLVDGTRFWLSVDSRLRVRPGYGGKARDVELDGEAYFRVEHDKARPFRVHTRGAVSEDLGTEFNVRAYSGDASEEVVVAVGRVAVRQAPTSPGIVADSSVELRRGQMSRLDRSGRMTVIDDVNPAIVAGWRTGQLKFKDTPIGDAVRELERWYDLDIVLDDSSLASVPLTASLGERTADQALAVIAGVLDATYQRNDRHVRLIPRPTRR